MKTNVSAMQQSKQPATSNTMDEVNELMECELFLMEAKYSFRIQRLEKENSRLRNRIEDLEFDNRVLQEIAVKKRKSMATLSPSKLNQY